MPIRGDVQGWFYIVQVAPKRVPGWIKLGFSTDVKDRLKSYKTIAPEAKVLAKWPCWASNEAEAIATIGNDPTCEFTGQEVIQCRDIKALVRRAELFFSVPRPPKPTVIKQLTLSFRRNHQKRDPSSPRLKPVDVRMKPAYLAHINEGKTDLELAAEFRVCDRTIRRWLKRGREEQWDAPNAKSRKKYTKKNAS